MHQDKERGKEVWNVDCRLMISLLTPRSSITFSPATLNDPSRPLSNLSVSQELESEPLHAETNNSHGRQTETTGQLSNMMQRRTATSGARAAITSDMAESGR